MKPRNMTKDGEIRTGRYPLKQASELLGSPDIGVEHDQTDDTVCLSLDMAWFGAVDLRRFAKDLKKVARVLERDAS